MTIEMVSIIATGDELVSGEIGNSNGQILAQRLTEEHIKIAQHIICSDQAEDIKAAIKYCAKQSRVIITTGGLGPTRDDRTRFAISELVAQPLEFHDATWQEICQRLQRFNLTIPENNKVQALFPKGGIILPNPHGTAAGCEIQWQNKIIYMLPGPPRECLPMFEQFVLPRMRQSLKHQNHHILRWRLFGVSEGEIAQQLEQLLQSYAVTTAYRVDYPYLDFKIHITKQAIHDDVKKLVDNHLQEHQICQATSHASEELRHFIAAHDIRLAIEDHVTAGLLEHKLSVPDTRKKITFIRKPSDTTEYDVFIIITGLEDYWHFQQDKKNTDIQLQFFYDNEEEIQLDSIPLRPHVTPQYASEWLAYKILNFLKTIDL